MFNAVEPTKFVVSITVALSLALLADRFLLANARPRVLLLVFCLIGAPLLVLVLPKVPLYLLPTHSREVDWTVVTPSYTEADIVYDGDPGVPLATQVLLVAALLGCLVYSVRILHTIILVRNADQVSDPETLDTLIELSHQVGLDSAPVLKVSDKVGMPFAFGWLQQFVVLPVTEQRIDDGLKLILRHELTHLKQRDPRLMVIAGFVAHVFWWNPVFLYGFHRLELAIEQRVDEHFKADATYRFLLNSLREKSARRAAHFLSLGGHLSARFRLLNDPAPPEPVRNLILVALPVLTTITVELKPTYTPTARQIGRDEVVYTLVTSDFRGLARSHTDGRFGGRLAESFASVGGHSVSPDGRWLAFTRLRNSQEDIFIASIDGTSERCLVKTNSRDVQPAWSPDGTKLVYCTMATGNWEIACVDIASAKSWPVTADGKRNLEPDWHPSGRQIVFSSHRTGIQKIWMMDSDGSNMRQLTFGTWEDTGATYSPDGTSVAFSTTRRGKYEATLLDLKTGFTRPLVSLSRIDTGEVEYCDGGQSLAMTSHNGSYRHVGKVRLSDSHFSQVTREESVWPASR